MLLYKFIDTPDLLIFELNIIIILRVDKIGIISNHYIFKIIIKLQSDLDFNRKGIKLSKGEV